MPQGPHTAGPPRLRILILDEHDVYRGACAALLRTEGLEVKDVAPGAQVIRIARSFEPNVVLIDTAVPSRRLRDTARRLRSLPCSPTVVLMSSTGQEQLDPGLAELPFVAKADVCAREVLKAHRVRPC